MKNSEICVPTSAVSIDGTAPALGDEIESTIKGKVTRVEGDKTYYTAETANGEPVPQPAEKMEERGEDMSDDDLSAAAQRYDDEGED